MLNAHATQLTLLDHFRTILIGISDKRVAIRHSPSLENPQNAHRHGVKAPLSVAAVEAVVVDVRWQSVELVGVRQFGQAVHRRRKDQGSDDNRGCERNSELFDAVLADAGTQVVLSGIRMPRMNSLMER